MGFQRAMNKLRQNMSALYEPSNRPVQDGTIRVFWAGGVPINVNGSTDARPSSADRFR